MRRTIIAVSALVVAVLAALAPAADEPAKTVALTEVKVGGLEKALVDQKNKVVLMDFWATWCLSCVKKFPHLVETHKKYADKGFTCISVSMDPKGKDEKYDKDAVLKFLKDKNATFPNFVLLGVGEDEEKITKRFGYEAGQLPYTAVFGRNGKKVWDSDSKELTNEELDKLIESELAKK